MASPARADPGARGENGNLENESTHQSKDPTCGKRFCYVRFHVKEMG